VCLWNLLVKIDKMIMNNELTDSGGVKHAEQYVTIVK
jgi:hypothetical protein